MSSTATLLLELGTEELPPGSLLKLSQALAQGLSEELSGHQLAHEPVQVFATPRRLAVQVPALQLQGEDQSIEVFGPPADRARLDNGDWSPAALGFAKKQGVTPDALQTAETDKGPRLVFREVAAGRKVVNVLPEILPGIIASLPVPKRMRWGSSREEFLRPVHWLVALLGGEVVPCSALGLSADRITYGHRFHHPDAITLSDADSYEDTLKQAYVLASFAKRKALITKQVEQQANIIGAKAVVDPGLLEEVTALVEWPVALTGNFESRFLAVPQEALVSSMAEHQKYFHLIDKEGQLLPHFIFVSNIESQDPAQVIDGNERVIRPRLADAAFFFESDKSTPLADRLPALGKVVFQQKLGTLLDKTERLAALARALAPAVNANPDEAARAATLSKADLTTQMVGEFSDLQGIAGRYYAQHDNESADVANAIEQHYWPAFAGDQLPSSPVAAVVALADRLDTLIGIFGIGQAPTGSKDPFALRRAALGVLRILVEMEFPLDLRECLQSAADGFPADVLASDTVGQVTDYVLERMRAWYEDDRIPVEVFKAVSAKALSVPLNIDQRVKAVDAFTALPEAVALAAANKRVSNILEKQAPDSKSLIVSERLLTEPAEAALHDAVEQQRPVMEAHLAKGHYTEALTGLASLQGPVDQFFDEVMVMAEAEDVRVNRLALLQSLRNLFLQVADISLLAPSK